MPPPLGLPGANPVARAMAPSNRAGRAPAMSGNEPRARAIPHTQAKARALQRAGTRDSNHFASNFPPKATFAIRFGWRNRPACCRGRHLLGLSNQK